MNRKFLWTMFILVVLIGLGVFLLLSDGKVQYNVVVRNLTSGPVTVKYQTQLGLEGMEHGEVQVHPEETFTVFESAAFQTADGSSDIDPSHCSQVADYLVVYDANDVRCIIEWCDPRIDLIREDLGQGTFEITVRPENFVTDPTAPDPALQTPNGESPK